MSYWKRWSSAIASRIDTVVARVENHDALADAALHDLKAGSARAHVRLDQVRQDRRRLRAGIEQSELAATQWRERAKHAQDEAKALECLRRSKQAQRRATELTARAEEHERIEDGLAKDLGRLRDRVAQLRDQRDLLRARESRADALRVASDVNACVSGEIPEIFERWELRIRESEYAGGCAEPVDALAEAFESEEETAALAAELAELRGAP